MTPALVLAAIAWVSLCAAVNWSATVSLPNQRKPTSSMTPIPRCVVFGGRPDLGRRRRPTRLVALGWIDGCWRVFVPALLACSSKTYDVVRGG
ncbi:hypothetical protein DB88DRAFT_500751 [Papiliotrema laurentii]|uniref:Secreted protein n=1 Tax=Papiliotrema laurentii TaxID=5418 RepID=A0AAD9CTX4_PAPLA|nr:hypothetical protein DB88DRAFT_500751 [Papiliotrema laurentii]